ncbi:MAG: hypothetical protein DMD49_04495 [Gemmatimonadetes bacterium]|nr:MAG: hypothetical protein DMD49_04495 [Gemmatimonadota bacterium]
MARVTRYAPLSLLALVLGATAGTAQVLDSAVVRSEVPICQSVKPGILVRVNTGHRGDQVGPVTRCDSLEIMVGPYLYPVDYVVPAAAVKRLWVQERAGTEGAVLGGALGALAGGLLAVAKSELCPGSSYAVTCRGNMVLGVAVGGAIGGAVGWTIGRVLPRWRRVYP